MKIDTSRVITDEELSATEQQLSDELSTLALLFQRPDTEGQARDEIEKAVNTGFALAVAETLIRGTLEGRLESRVDLPDKLAELEHIGAHEMPTEIERIKATLKDTFPLPVSEITALYSKVLSERYDQLKIELKREKRKRVLGRPAATQELSGGEAPPSPSKFTRKEAIYLLQELIPEFKNAENTRKAEFISRLTGYSGTKNIADEFSNIRNFERPELLAEWRNKFKSSGRGRKKNKP